MVLTVFNLISTESQQEFSWQIMLLLHLSPHDGSCLEALSMAFSLIFGTSFYIQHVSVLAWSSEWHVTTIPYQVTRDATKQLDFKSVSHSLLTTITVEPKILG